MRIKNRVLGTIGFAVAATVALTGCGSVAPETDEQPIIYEGSWIIPVAKEFKGCADPGSQQYVWNDDEYTYPFGQRTWQFGGEGADSGTIEVITQDQQKMFVRGVVTFALNSDCTPISGAPAEGEEEGEVVWPGGTFQQFHERIGRKYNAWTDEGWVRFLELYLDEPLNKALDTVSQQYSYEELYGGSEDIATSKKEWEEKVGAQVIQDINAQAGMDLFCQPSYNGSGECGNLSLTLQKPQISDELAAALEGQEIAKAENKEQAERNVQQRTELEGVQDRIDVLGGVENFLLERAIEKGSIEILPLPEDSGILLGR